jgi:hypothetical protein
VIAATSVLVEEVMNIALGQQLEVLTPHQIRATTKSLVDVQRKAD